jgi:hypothetical protein
MPGWQAADIATLDRPKAAFAPLAEHLVRNEGIGQPFMAECPGLPPTSIRVVQAPRRHGDAGKKSQD